MLLIDKTALFRSVATLSMCSLVRWFKELMVFMYIASSPSIMKTFPMKHKYFKKLAKYQQTVLQRLNMVFQIMTGFS